MTTRPTLVATGNGILENGVRYDADVLQSAIWMQEMLLGANTEGGAISPAGLEALPWTKRNILANGGFEIYQRGVGPFDASAFDAAASDGWQCSFGTWSKETTITDGSPASLKATAASGSAPFLKQTVYNVEAYRGRKVTLTGRVRGAPGHLLINDLVGADNTNAASDIRDASAGWTTYSATITVRSAATKIECWWVADATPATFYLDNFCLTAEDGPVAFAPEQPAYSWLKLRRRYLRVNVSIRFMSAAVVGIEYITIPFAEPMLATPACSITLNGTNGVDYGNINTGSLAIGAVFADSAIVQVVPTNTVSNTWIYAATFIADALVF